MFSTWRVACTLALLMVGGAAEKLCAQPVATPAGFKLSATPLCRAAQPAAPAVDLYWTTQLQVLSYQIFQNGTPVALLPGSGGMFRVAPLTAGQTYSYFVRASYQWGGLADSATVSVIIPPGTCPTGSNCPLGAVCSDDGRFQVTAHWILPPDGGIEQSGAGTPVPLSDDTGGFWFFSPSSLDLMVKVLDGTSVNGYFWVFYGALSNTEYYVDIYDTQTGIARQYHNPAGTLASFADTAAFPADPPPPPPAPAVADGGIDAASSTDSGAGHLAPPTQAASQATLATRMAAEVPGGAPTARPPGDRALSGDRAASGVQAAAAALSASVRQLAEAEILAPEAATAEPGLSDAGAGQPACVPATGALCLLGGRFQVSVAWTLAAGAPLTAATAVPLTDGTGYFWFFASTNAELLVKQIDGRPVNGHFWFFYGSLSDVAYTITLTDTVTGATRTYQNPAGNLASVADVTAF